MSNKYAWVFASFRVTIFVQFVVNFVLGLLDMSSRILLYFKIDLFRYSAHRAGYVLNTFSFTRELERMSSCIE